MVDNPFEKILGINKQFNKKGILMLNKFEEQYLLASVERLEDIKKEITKIWSDNNYYVNDEKINNSIDKVISDIKNINPRLFSYPKVATYNTVDGKYPTTPIINDD